ncbi:MAG: BrnT family toxin [Crocosphaera sp.]|jgi:uncharacterized DUF497 family protein/uncharacterized protein (DUF4415 family)
MEFEWDDQKNKINIEKHGIDFNFAKEVFSVVWISKPDNRKDYGEERLIALGLLGEFVLVIVYTLRGEKYDSYLQDSLMQKKGVFIMPMSRKEQLKILGQMKESDIDYSDVPATDTEFWQEATLNPPLKVPVTLQLDPSVLAWYKQQFPQEYHTLINAVLEKYMIEHTC